ncbi:MAG: MGMT family protein [Candidatus Bathyarchaeia archaeon]
MISIYHQKIDETWYALALEKEKIYATNFGFNESHVLRQVLESLPYNMPFQLEETPSPFSRKILETLKAIYDGKGISSNFELAFNCLKEYSRRVLGYLAYVPVGYITTYNALAKIAGGSPRAVGQVMAHNPFPLLIPCHRVVKNDWTLGGFGGSEKGLGVKIKLEILRREDRGYKTGKEVTIEGKVLSLFPVCWLKPLRKGKN